MFKYSKGIRGFLRNLDLPLSLLTLCTAIFGIIMISSAGGERGAGYVAVQGGALIIGIIGICILMFLDYEYLSRLSFYMSIAGLGLLVLVLIPGIGQVHNGARSWFGLGPVNLQPAELAKIVFIIVMAKELAEKESRINEPRTVLSLGAYLAVPAVLILLQPDFGTASVFMAIWIVMIFVSGISKKYIAIGAGGLAVLCPLMWFFVLQDYQKSRILTVFNPQNDPSGAGYHVLQSQQAIGSGRIFGAGLYKGSSQVNNLLPERHTDFIYSVICEELGIIGGVLVIILMSAIIIRCIYIGMNARNSLGTYMCVGVSAMLMFQTFENIGMCIGIFPVTGITLPFFSYGGSSLLTTMLAIGIVLSVKYKSRIINF